MWLLLGQFWCGLVDVLFLSEFWVMIGFSLAGKENVSRMTYAVLSVVLETSDTTTGGVSVVVCTDGTVATEVTSIEDIS